jgi:hypothetical protein
LGERTPSRSRSTSSSEAPSPGTSTGWPFSVKAMPAVTTPTIGSSVVISRRTFLAAGAGLVLAGACGGKASSSGGGSGLGKGTVLVPFFKDGMQAAGLPQRFPLGLGDTNGVLTTGGPDELHFVITDAYDSVVLPDVVATRHSQDLPRPYWPLMLQLSTPGIYTASIRGGDASETASFTIPDPGSVPIPKIGDKMVPVDTPTVTDARGVTPICTRTPACPLHDITLTEALKEGKPLAFFIGTPAYCQTGICGPTLDVLLAQRGGFPTIRMLHAEIYVNPQQALSASTTDDQGASFGATTATVQAYNLPFEPVLYLAKPDGTIFNRLDNIYDTNELKQALAALIA